MKKSKNIIFFGSDSFSLPSLLTLLEDTYWQVAAVVSRPDKRAGRGRQLVATPPKQLGEQYQVPVLTPEKLDAEAVAQIQAFEASLAVVVSYGQLIPNQLLDHFSHQVLNIHPSLLPRYRGPSPIESVLLDGESETGVTLMQLSPEMDAGPIYAQVSLPLDGSETSPELYESLALTGAKLLLENILKITEGELLPKAQNHEQATYTELITKDDGIIDWSKSATRLEREVRAYLGWPGSRTTLADTEITITAAEAVPDLNGERTDPGNASVSADNKVAVSCGEGFLLISHLKPAGKREMTAQEFLAGNPL